jgi:hypothetical protein
VGQSQHVKNTGTTYSQQLQHELQTIATCREYCCNTDMQQLQQQKTNRSKAVSSPRGCARSGSRAPPRVLAAVAGAPPRLHVEVVEDPPASVAFHDLLRARCSAAFSPRAPCSTTRRCGPLLRRRHAARCSPPQSVVDLASRGSSCSRLQERRPPGRRACPSSNRGKRGRALPSLAA